MAMQKKRFFQAVVAIFVLAAGVLGMMAITAGRQDVGKQIPEPPLPVVQAEPVQTETIRVVVRGEGSVQPKREIQLIPQVAGKIRWISPNFVNGGAFLKDERLLQIDSIDYELAVILAEALVKESESRLRLAEEEAAAALDEWNMLHGDGAAQPLDIPPLVARQPQLAAVRAGLAAHRAELQRARLNLERTTIRAPFAGRFSDKRVDLGQYVTPGQVLAAVYSIDTAEIVLPMEDQNLRWIHVPGFTETGESGSPVVVTAEVAGQRMQWSGMIVRSEGKIDPMTRMVNLVATVPDPYATRPPLAPGLFVKVDIEGKTLENVVRIPREVLRQGNVVWVVDASGALRFRTVVVARSDDQSVILRSGLEPGDRVVVTNIKAVSDGMKVRVAGDGGGGAGS
jgi:RND family efflux transporter MFP subunit